MAELKSVFYHGNRKETKSSTRMKGRQQASKQVRLGDRSQVRAGHTNSVSQGSALGQTQQEKELQCRGLTDLGLIWSDSPLLSSRGQTLAPPGPLQNLQLGKWHHYQN